ncbi:unnamed protein product [Leptosia nina]|uniref:DNA repair protein complementing XP-G cells n=1 Tax=Leptosia nina TaxID=320188 RepID=A0AAV1J5R2_9NEOP
MGVTGLWRLIEPAGKPVPVETLENKVLAVDISIWLHQVVKGYQDAKGAPLPNAHLMGLFQRLCKLLYFRIKPIFVFDGGVPDLKRQTIAKRQDNKNKQNSESERLKRELALLIGKKAAVGALLGKEISPKKLNLNQNDEDIFKLPELPAQEDQSVSESEDEESSSASTVDLHTVDLESKEFKTMPSKEKYELLLELKETRKMNSWGKLHTLPKKSDSFSDFQMQRLLKRRKVQECIEETEKEIGDVGMSLNELESLLNEEGIDTKIEDLPTRRIASDQTTRFLLINNVKQALSDAKKLKEEEEQRKTKQLGLEMEQKPADVVDTTEEKRFDELEDDLQRAIKMSLECVDEAGGSSSATTSKADESWSTLMTDSDSDCLDDEQDDFLPPAMSSAKAYIMQYSDFTHKVIDNIVSSRMSDKNKVREHNVDDIIAELNNENSIIDDRVDIDDEIETYHEVEFENSPGQSSTSKIPYRKTKVDDVKADEINLNSNENDSSLIYLGKGENNIYDLDTIQDVSNINSSLNNSTSSNSEDEFEEVSETENKSSKPTIQVMLKLEDKNIEDDIFADVFNKPKEEVKLSENKNNESGNIIDTNPTKNQSVPKAISKENIEIERQTVEKPNSTMLQSKTKSLSKENNGNAELKAHTETDELKTADKNGSQVDANTKEKLKSMEVTIESEQQQLIQEKGRLDRIGRNISEQMTKDAQELLRVFGIPYIVAPMEAEAQCAFLEDVNLTDGTITDDSDIWLFGGKTVYKNFFNHKKHVLQFVSERIEKSYNLTREQLILLALLVGSDYTTGVSGVGPVTALEILASFPFNKKKLFSEISKQDQYKLILSGLQEFKQWVRTGRRTDNVTLKKKLKNVQLTEDFPSVRVVQAYLEPNIEKNKDKFTWGQIDITVLRDYTKDKFGWSQNKLDEIIKPVLKRMLDRKQQKTVHDYFKRKSNSESLDDQMSKRVKAAVKKLDPNSPNDTNQEKVDNNAKQKTGRKRKVTGEVKDIKQVVKVSTTEDRSDFNFIVPKSDTCQELIPQRERVKKSLLENKLKAIEIFRKTKIDRKQKLTKKRAALPKDRAELSESSDSD